MPTRTQLLTTAAVADQLGLSTRQIKRLMTSGALPSVKIGSSRRISSDTLENFIRFREEDSSAGHVMRSGIWPGFMRHGLKQTVGED